MVYQARKREIRRAAILALAALLSTHPPAGAEVTDTPKPQTRYMDSSIGGTAEAFRDIDDDPELTPEQKTELKAFFGAAPVTTALFAALRDAECPAVQTHYIDGADEVVQFARHAVANGDCSMSLYLGHGRGTARDGINQAVADQVAAAFAPMNLRSGTATSVSPKFGFWSCWAGNYNDTVHEFYRTSFGWDNRGISGVNELVEHLASGRDAINTELAILCEECRNSVTLHMYFGSMDGPAAGIDNRNGFPTWK